MYFWKLTEGIVPNCGVSWEWDPNKGRMGIIPKMVKSAPDSVKSIRDRSFHYAAPRVFNLLPRCLRDLTGCSKESWKTNLDRFLELVPDTPAVGEYVPHRSHPVTARPSNDLIDWITWLNINGDRSWYEFNIKKKSHSDKVLNV